MNPHGDPFTAAARAMDQIIWAANRAVDRLHDELDYQAAGGTDVDRELSELDFILHAKRGCRR